MEFDFDPTEAEPSRGSYPAIPAGKYVMHAVSAEQKDNSKGSGSLLAVVWEVSEGEFAGAMIFENINTHHENEIAMRIGREQLSAICAAAMPGQPVKNSDQLIGKQVLNTVKFIPEGTVDKSGYKHTADKNEITAHEAVNGASPVNRHAAPAARPATPPPAATAPAVARPAWKAATHAPAAVNGALAAPAGGAWRTPRANA